MEITFLEKFCETGNLRALLNSPGLPPTIQPFFRQLRAFYDPIPFEPSNNNQNYQDMLDSETYQALIEKINNKNPLEDKLWISSNEYSAKDIYDRLSFAPINSRVNLLKSHSSGDVVYSTFAHNPSNSVIGLKDHATYGRINTIFEHSRVLPNGTAASDLFFVIHPLLPIPPGPNNPFNLSNYEVNVSLRMFHPDARILIAHHSEILCHCAWMHFMPGEISDQIKFETIAVVLLDRS